ncbi:uncharacterized protein LOC112906304 [Agrilus planipennis]|uniref:Uncharacterized protein LOC112906304 n=1 Tax=Agrilus planipennis TaxID=224129 RepID=A0A7F5RJ53_AGRPL|nr:uncharacterized protein LOC112906304 [Agrilus planipennis]
MCTVDLKDAYYLLPIRLSHRKFLRFTFKGTLYEYNCLPFGLNCAPQIFTKILKPVIKFLREKNVILVVYLDDFLILGQSFDECMHNVKLTINLLNYLGFLINYEKCNLLPSNSCAFLGFIYDSNTMSISLPDDKRERILKILKRLLKISECTIRRFSRFLGTIVSACPTIKYGFLHTKIFERQKMLALKKSGGNYNALMKISAYLIDDLNWFIKNVPKSFNNIRVDKYHMEIFTDASGSGWGAYCRGNSTHGFWSDEEKKFHINYLELLALCLGLQCFTSKLSSCNLLCRLDNTTAVACINKMGSVRFKHLQEITSRIWNYCEERNIHILASYINTKVNRDADIASRQQHRETEWSLSVDAFQEIETVFGKLSVDLFC